MPKFAFYFFVALFAIILTESIASEDGKDDKVAYDIKYDNIDIDELLKSERLLTNYIKCLMEEGSCTEDGRALKDSLPDAINTDCSKCSEKQKVGSEKVMHYIIDNRPEDWDRLEQKYDPSGAYKNGYLQSKAKSESNDN